MYTTRTKQIYIRKLFPHDLTHEVSVTTEVVSDFFENCEKLTFYKGADHDTKYTVTINNTTDPRFGGAFASLWSADGLGVNDLIIIKKISSNEFELTTAKKGTSLYEYMEKTLTGSLRHAVLISDESGDLSVHIPDTGISEPLLLQYITAIRTKPFLLLAGISGTGKSRIVRQLARACDTIDADPKTVQKPANFEMVQVKPNWHDSSELIGYVSRVDGEKFIAGDFLKFVAKAWEYNKEISGEEDSVPFFLCLDEMNLAPVEQYFAEYLSVIESRKLAEEGKIVTDPLLKAEPQQWYHDLVLTLTEDAALQEKLLKEGIAIPDNLIVVGTVNMDETTYSFSRKVLDRAMTIEMNEVDLLGGLTDESYDDMGTIEPKQILANCVEGKDVYAGNEEVCNNVIKNYLQPVNDVLEGTPFKIAYRTRNEFLLYVINSIRLNSDKDTNAVIVNALDEVTGMKILSRIEGDESKVSKAFLERLKTAISDGFKTFADAAYVGAKEEGKTFSSSLAKLASMSKKLDTGYTSFWD